MDKPERMEPTAEISEIGELAKPLAKYLSDNNMVCTAIVVTMDSVSTFTEGFTANFIRDLGGINHA